MKALSDLYRLRSKLLWKSSVWVIPTIASAVFLAAMYSVPPINICSTYLLSAVFLYVVCVFLSMSMNGREEDVFEETLLLHSDRASKYYTSRELMFLSLCGIYSLLLILIPVLLFFLNKSKFTRPIEGTDILCGGANIFFCGYAGMEIGDLFHARILQKRRNAILGVIFVSMLAVCKYGLIAFHSFFRILHVMLPPIMDGFERFTRIDRFEIGGAVLICLHLIVYILIVTLIKIKLLTWKRYRY